MIAMFGKNEDKSYDEKPKKKENISNILKEQLKY